MHYEKLKDTVINASTDFWIGDPCYVVPDTHWGPLCDNWQSYEKEHEDNPDNTPLPRSYVAEVQDEETGYVFYCWSTAYGDGSYKLFVNEKEVASLPVDAGTLSAIPVGLIKHWKDTGQISDYEGLGHVVGEENLQGELVSENGDMFWGSVRLPTGYEEESDEDDPWSECEEEGYFL